MNDLSRTEQKITTYLLFQDGRAEEAMEFYASLFKNSEIIEKDYSNGDMLGIFSLNGQRFMCLESSIPHRFGFTPAMSLYVTCETKEEVDELFAALSKDGEVLMPLGSYPFSERFAWVVDRFGVSWQLVLE